MMLPPTEIVTLGDRDHVEHLQDLAPKRKDLVLDLVRQAGVDVSDWSNSIRGPRGASTNPKYCYEWAFHDGDIVVLNLWHSEMEEIEGAIIRRGNFRADFERNRREKKGTAGARAYRIDVVIQEAATRGLPVRVIVNAGSPRTRDPMAKKSTVKLRELDPEPWRVSKYDDLTGAHVLTRGTVVPWIDQFSVFDGGGRPAEWRDRSGRVFIREAAIRRAALRRADGCCEYCGGRGFLTIAGLVYLETHHVVPLSEGGADETFNVIALCANHHREAHHGHDRAALRAAFQEILALSSAPPSDRNDVVEWA